MEILKAPERMSAKERVRRTFEYEKTDRVTIGYDTNPVIHRNLCRALACGRTTTKRCCKNWASITAALPRPISESRCTARPRTGG